MTRDQLKKLECELWAAADNLRANSDLKAGEYSTPVLGLIFLKFADNKYRQHEDAILAEYGALKGTRRDLFATSLKPTGRAALVMANSASNARHSEAGIRRTLVEQNLIYGMLTLPSNLFYTVTLPATLWFFDRAKPDERALFKQKCDNVFDLAVDYASRGRKWAA